MLKDILLSKYKNMRKIGTQVFLFSDHWGLQRVKHQQGQNYLHILQPKILLSLMQIYLHANINQLQPNHFLIHKSNDECAKAGKSSTSSFITLKLQPFIVSSFLFNLFFFFSPSFPLSSLPSFSFLHSFSFFFTFFSFFHFLNISQILICGHSIFLCLITEIMNFKLMKL